MIGRIAMALLALTLLLSVGAYVGDWRINLSPDQAELIGWRQGLSEEEAMRRDVQWRASPTIISGKVTAALDRNDVDDAAMYSDLANWAEISLGADLAARLSSAQSAAAAAPQDLSSYANGFVFGAPTSLAALASGIAADTTVVGDARDVAKEGALLLKGETFDDITLGLSVVGIAATTKTVPTEGGGAVIKSGGASLKFARRIRSLTDEFSVRLKQIIGAAVDFQKLEATLKGVDLADMAKTQASLVEFSQTIEPAPLFPILADMDAICTATGIGECIRLVSVVRTPEDLGELVGVAKAAGPRARGVIELTGMTTAGAFKNSVHIVQFMVENIAVISLWTIALVVLSFWRWFLPRREQQFQKIPVRTRSKRHR